jgi:hypothetical protein
MIIVFKDAVCFIAYFELCVKDIESSAGVCRI